MPERKIIFTRSRIADVSASGCCCCCLRRKELTREARGGTAGGREVYCGVGRSPWESVTLRHTHTHNLMICVPAASLRIPAFPTVFSPTSVGTTWSRNGRPARQGSMTLRRNCATKRRRRTPLFFQNASARPLPLPPSNA